MKTLLATLAVGTAVAAAVALPATGQETPATRTLTLTSVQAKDAEHSIDAPPRGQSMGDSFVFASTLRNGAQLAGRMEGDCLAVDVKFQGLQCTLTAVLADGSITLQGASLSKHIPGATAPSAGRLRDHRRDRRVRRRRGHDAPQRQRQDRHGRLRAAVRLLVVRARLRRRAARAAREGGCRRVRGARRRVLARQRSSACRVSTS